MMVKFFDIGFFVLVLVSSVVVKFCKFCDGFVIYEVEDVIFIGIIVDIVQVGYIGCGYVIGFDEGFDKIIFQISFVIIKFYDFFIWYVVIYGDK